MQWLNKHLAETTASRVGGKERADRRSEIHPTFGDLQLLIGLLSEKKRKNKFGCFEVQMSQIPRASHGVRRRRRSQPTTERNSSFSYTRVPPLFFRSSAVHRLTPLSVRHPRVTSRIFARCCVANVPGRGAGVMLAAYANIH